MIEKVKRMVRVRKSREAVTVILFFLKKANREKRKKDLTIERALKKKLFRPFVFCKMTRLTISAIKSPDWPMPIEKRTGNDEKSKAKRVRKEMIFSF
jgi:hypothetical protein